MGVSGHQELTCCAASSPHIRRSREIYPYSLLRRLRSGLTISDLFELNTSNLVLALQVVLTASMILVSTKLVLW
jgi:hypothetical protein